MKKVVTLILAFLLFISLAACTDSYSAQDLQDAKERYASGKYSREDEHMVEGFYKWKAEQNKYTD